MERATTETPAPITEQFVTGFDYTGLAPEVVADLRRAATCINASKRNITQAVFAIGSELNRIKKHELDHGEFGKWLAAECNLNVRSAQRFMKAASEFTGKYDTVSYLPVTTIHRLAAAPQAVRDAVLSGIEEDKERPDPKTIEKMVADAKQQQIEEDRAQRQAARRAKLTEEQRQAEDARIKRQRRTREQREKQQAEIAAQWDAKRASEAAALQEIAQILAARLGPDMDRFLVLTGKFHYFRDVLNILNAESRGPAGNGADNVISLRRQSETDDHPSATGCSAE